MDSQTLTVILCLAAALAIGWLVYQEQLARPLRTRVLELPGCLRFEARTFQVEMQQAAKLVKVHTENGDLSQTALADGAKKVLSGPLDLSFAAAGGFQPMDLAVSRAWQASSDQPWCTVNPEAGSPGNPRVFVTTERNESGADRFANITFQTSDGKGKSTTRVFQSRL